MITIIGLGVTPGDLTLRAAEALRAAPVVYLRTERHSSALRLGGMGIAYLTFDSLYESAEDFDELYAAMAREIVSSGEAVFCVPGGAAMGDASVRAVTDACKERNIDWEIIPGIGWEAYAAAWGGGCEGLTAVSARDAGAVDPRRALVVTEIDTRAAAGELKLRLMEHYPDAHRVLLDGQSIALYEIDRAEAYSVDTTLLVPPLALMEAERFDFEHLCEIVDILRDPVNGCPWDREQTHESLTKFLIEEAYEAREAIKSGDPMQIADELGDVLLQVALHARIAKERGDFNVTDVTSSICQKMISRHTHIFGEASAETAAEVSKSWAEIKRLEKGLATLEQTLNEVPRGFPAWLRAEKMLNRLRGIRFDFKEKLADSFETAQKSEENFHAALDGLVEAVARMEAIAGSNGKSLEELNEKDLFDLWKSAKVP